MRSTLAAAIAGAQLFMPSEAPAQFATDVVCSGCVDTDDIRARAIKRDRIENGAINPAKLAPTAKPAGVGFTENGTSTNFNPIPTVQTVATTITMDVPAAGFVIVNATGYVRFDGAVQVDCGITQGAIIDGG
jgi:hypothetical protein